MRRLALLLVLSISVLGACKGDRNKCEAACRNFFTLTYWKKADAEIAALPAAEREAAKKKKLSEFANMIEDGVEMCVNQCSSANNDDQIDCLTKAKTADEAQACVAEKDD